MRILHLVTSRKRRGAEMAAADLAAELASRGHEIMYAGLYAAPADALVPDRVRVADVGWNGTGVLHYLTIAKLGRLIAAFEPDIVQANGSDTLKYSVLVKTLYRFQWSLVYRNISLASHWIRHRRQRWANRCLVRHVDHVASVSAASREDFIRTYRVPEAKVSVIRRGVRPLPHVDRAEARAAVCAETGIPPGGRILMQIGEFSPEKNHLWATRAFARLASRCDAHFVLVGDGTLRTAITAEIERLSLWRRVHLLGMRRDAHRLVGAADLLLLPSRVEGVPGVVLEAAACGVPAVAMDVGGVGEAISNGVTGLLVALDDMDSFVGAVTELLHDHNKRVAMGEAARALVAERFDLRESADKFEELYRRLR